MEIVTYLDRNERLFQFLHWIKYRKCIPKYFQSTLILILSLGWEHSFWPMLGML